MTQIIYDQDKERLYRKAAELIEKSISSILENKDRAIIAIPGGRSVPGVFRNLKDRDIPWQDVHIFMVDERLVPIDDKQSNFRLAKEAFIDELVSSGKLPKGNIHPFVYAKDKADYGIWDYEEEIKRLGGDYDIVLLSSGEDGHVGALYPEHSSIEDDSEHYIMMHDSPKPPPDRMSMSRKMLLRAKAAIIMFLGEAKKDAFRRFNEDNIDHKECPAKLVQDIKDSYALTDVIPEQEE